MSITVYSRPTCSPCKQVKSYLKRKGKDFVEKDVSNLQYAKEAVKLSGVISVPVILVGEKVIIGPNIPVLASLIN